MSVQLVPESAENDVPDLVGGPARKDHRAARPGATDSSLCAGGGLDRGSVNPVPRHPPVRPHPHPPTARRQGGDHAARYPGDLQSAAQVTDVEDTHPPHMKS